MVENKRIEIDDKEVRIISKTGAQREIINLKEVDKIILQENYSMPLETLKEIGQDMSEKPNQNYLVLQQNSERRKFEFEIDSHFMLKQLDKIIHSWESKGYTVARMNSN